MNDPFDSPRTLIRRARKHIEDVSERIKVFLDNCPRVVFIEYDNDAVQEIHKVRFTRAIPTEVTAIVKDATSNLRDALDHAVYASAVSLAGGNPDYTGFPFARDARGVEGELNGRRLRGNPVEIRPFLASLQPYETGNKVLFGLNQIRKANTHRMLVPVGQIASVNQMEMVHAAFSGKGQFGYSRWDAAASELEFLRIPRGSACNYQVKVCFLVAFGDVGVFGGQDVVGTLNDIMGEIDQIVLGVEQETHRLLRDPNN